MIYPCLGHIQGNRTSYLVQAQTVKGQSVIKLDGDCDGRVDHKDEVLVLRDRADEKADWRPVESTEELQAFLEANPSAQDRGDKLGLWRDKRSWLIFPRDGQIQRNEVTPMSVRWNTEKFHHYEEVPHPKARLNEYEGYFYVKPQGDKVFLETRGSVVCFQEPLANSRVRIDHVTHVGRDGVNDIPLATKSYEFKPD